MSEIIGTKSVREERRERKGETSFSHQGSWEYEKHGKGGGGASLSKTKHKPLPYIPNVSSVNVILSHE